MELINKSLVSKSDNLLCESFFEMLDKDKDGFIGLKDL